jgi:hypothetical protein
MQHRSLQEHVTQPSADDSVASVWKGFSHHVDRWPIRCTADFHQGYILGCRLDESEVDGEALKFWGWLRCRDVQSHSVRSPGAVGLGRSVSFLDCEVGIIGVWAEAEGT